MFCPPHMTYLQNIKKALILFHLSFGLKINFHKSSIMGLNVSNDWLDCATNDLYCKKGTIPFTYLGLPIGGNSSRLCLWDPILQRMETKLASWRGKLLSIGGRLTLIKSCLSNLPVYFMSIFSVPHGIIDKIIKLQRNLLWSGSMEKNAMALINWKTVELPRSLGGLSVGNILHRNLALMYKWIWRYFAEPNSLWRRVIQAKYKYSSNSTILDLDTPKHGGPWKSLCTHILKNPEAKAIALSQGKKLEMVLKPFFGSTHGWAQPH